MRNVVILLLDFLAFAVLLSAYIGYKTRNNYFGLGSFFFFLIIISYLTVSSGTVLKRDFTQVSLVYAYNPISLEQEKQYKTIKAWIEWQKEKNQKRNKLNKDSRQPHFVPRFTKV